MMEKSYLMANKSSNKKSKSTLEINAIQATITKVCDKKPHNPTCMRLKAYHNYKYAMHMSKLYQ